MITESGEIKLSIRHEIEQYWLQSDAFKKQLKLIGIVIGDENYKKLLDELKSISYIQDENYVDGLNMFLPGGQDLVPVWPIKNMYNAIGFVV